MKLKKWLKYTDILGFMVVIWTKDQLEHDENEPLYAGSALDIPYWIADCKLYLSEDDAAVSYRGSLGNEYNNKPGFVICVEDL